MQPLTFENYKGQIILHSYMLSLYKKNFWICTYSVIIPKYFFYSRPLSFLLLCESRWSFPSFHSRCLCGTLQKQDLYAVVHMNSLLTLSVITPSTCSSNKSAFQSDTFFIVHNWKLSNLFDSGALLLFIINIIRVQREYSHWVQSHDTEEGQSDCLLRD